MVFLTWYIPTFFAKFHNESKTQCCTVTMESNNRRIEHFQNSQKNVITDLSSDVLEHLPFKSYF